MNSYIDTYCNLYVCVWLFTNDNTIYNLLFGIYYLMARGVVNVWDDREVDGYTLYKLYNNVCVYLVHIEQCINVGDWYNTTIGYFEGVLEVCL